MNNITTMLIFLGITFTLVGSAGSIIILCMHGITWLQNKCKKNDEMVLLMDEGGEMDDFVKL